MTATAYRAHVATGAARIPGNAVSRNIREQLFQKYRASGITDLEEFAKANNLPWPDARDLITATECTLRLRDALVRMGLTC